MPQRKSFLFYKDWYEAISSLDADVRLEVYDAIMSRVWRSDSCTLSPMAELSMRFISPQIDRDEAKYREISDKRSEAGKKHRGNQYSFLEQMEQDGTNGTSVPNLEQNGTNGTDDDNDNDNVENNIVLYEERKDTDVSVIKKEKRFVKPTVDEIRDYIQEKGYTFDAEAFFAYYESNGWKVGRNPMKNWRMACTTWSKNRNNNNGNNYGRETITDKIRRTVEGANEFKQRIDANIGREADMGDGDSDKVW